MHPSDLWRKPAGRPLIMGILNLTPDSFSDGGGHLSEKDALEHAYDMIDGGADIIDIGGESSRPGAVPVPEEEEVRRIIGVIKDLASTVDVPLSIDTAKPHVAEVSVKAGASIINDIFGLRDDRMIDISVSNDIPAVIVHMHGTPPTFYTDTMEGDVLAEIGRFLGERADYAISRGMKERNIIVDPGIGFGKTAEQDILITENCGRFGDNFPVLAGPSRKRFLSALYPGMESDEATARASLKAAESGARIIRVHNVQMTASCLGRFT